MATAIPTRPCEITQIKMLDCESDFLDEYHSSELQSIQNIRLNINTHYLTPATRNDRTIFYTLLTEWNNDTKFISSTTKKLEHPAFKNIVNMGQNVIPFIFEEIQNTPSLLFAALNYITGLNPIKPENIGNVRRMIEDWVEWGKENGYI